MSFLLKFVWTFFFLVVLVFFSLVFFMYYDVNFKTLVSKRLNSNILYKNKIVQSILNAVYSSHENKKHHTVGANSRCVNISLPMYLLKGDTWLPVDNNKLAYVFSAYFVEKLKTLVTIGLAHEDKSNYFCRVWYKTSTKHSFSLIEADVWTLPESHLKRYSATLFECRLNASALPAFVSIVTTYCETPLNVIPVRLIAQELKYKRRFTVCPSPLHYKFHRDYELIEWIELNKILGAEKFIFYNFSSASNVARVLDFYSKRGIAEVVQWPIPVRVDIISDAVNNKTEIHYFGQVAALYDCLHRSKPYSEFVVHIDIDEYIIPHLHNVTTWSDMLYYLNKNAVAYIFRNTFFVKDWTYTNISIPNMTLVETLNLVTLQTFEHEKYIYPSGSRSKYIAKTSQVSHIRIHDVLDFFKDKIKGAQTVSPEIGLLHHYRDWNVTNNAPENRVLDQTIPNKYGEDLLQNILKVLLELNADVPVTDHKYFNGNHSDAMF